MFAILKPQVNLKIKYFLLISLLTIACKSSEQKVSEEEFFRIMENIAHGWSIQNTDLALSSFDEDAIYMQPPNIQYYRGHQQLRPYFDELDSNYKMNFHNLWFNQKNQTGAGEFTFSYGKDTSDIGIVVVELNNGKIKFWREYLTKGPTDFKEFLKIEDKNWEWHIGNYPEPKDSIIN